VIRALLAAALIGCSSNEPAPAPVSDTGPACTYAASVASCSACVSSNCCAEIAACDADVVCRGFGDCIARCPAGDTACTAKCRVDRPTGYGLLASELETCVAKSCDRPCGITCGGYISNESKCTECTQAKCCAETTTCLGDRDCAALLACERACYVYDGQCLGACERRYPAVVEAARTVSTCIAKSCDDACLPPRWRCLDPYPPRPVASHAPHDRVQINLRTQEFGSGTSVAGLTVTACQPLAWDHCLVAAGPFVTDSTGYTLFDIPTPSGVFDGYFEIKGEGYVPSLYYVGPQPEDSWWLINVVSPPLLDALTSSIVPPEPSKGHIIITAGDCLTPTAPGISFTISPQGDAVSAYLSDGVGVPTRDATETGSSGFGGFINVITNTGIRVRAKAVAYDRDFPVDYTVFARPGHITYVNIRPYKLQ
jgi:hypothetical protein